MLAQGSLCQVVLRRLVLPSASLIQQYCYATSQFKEACESPRPKVTQGADNPPIIPDRGPESIEIGRSSQTDSSALAPKDIQELVQELFCVYEKDPTEQRRIIDKHYEPGAYYENNVVKLKGKANIIKHFALLTKDCKEVNVTYQPAVLLGATTSAPEGLDDLRIKGDLQVI